MAVPYLFRIIYLGNYNLHNRVVYNLYSSTVGVESNVIFRRMHTSSGVAQLTVCDGIMNYVKYQAVLRDNQLMSARNLFRNGQKTRHLFINDRIEANGVGLNNIYCIPKHAMHI